MFTEFIAFSIAIIGSYFFYSRKQLESTQEYRRYFGDLDSALVELRRELGDLREQLDTTIRNREEDRNARNS